VVVSKSLKNFTGFNARPFHQPVEDFEVGRVPSSKTNVGGTKKTQGRPVPRGNILWKDVDHIGNRKFEIEKYLKAGFREWSRKGLYVAAKALDLRPAI
jgi:hypothetical protein